MRSEPLDLLLIGCGLRGTGLLTATPELFDRCIGIVEAADSLGPGSFAEYRIESNSSGSDFFGWVDPRGPFGEVLAHPDVVALRTEKGSFRLPLLGRALRHFGAAIARRLCPEHLLLKERVARIDDHGDTCTATLTSGRRLAARSVVLATGIREAARSELARWQSKVLRSQQIVKNPACLLVADRLPASIVIVGSSHSGYAVATILKELMDAAPERYAEVTIVHRAPVKLLYSDWSEFQHSERCPLEAIPDPARDRCPETGNLFRYSGLRHGARALFRAASKGQLPWLRQIRVRELAEATPLLERAVLIVQAMGYESNTIPLFQRGRQLWSGHDNLVVQPDASGRILADGGRLFPMGMDPYPYRDNSVTPTGQYAVRGKQIMNLLRYGL